LASVPPGHQCLVWLPAAAASGGIGGAGLATFVLVHGAMHGGWCWRDVRQRLTAAGHDVYAPTLTGQGERRQALTPEVGLATHVTDLTELIYFEDLSDVHLVLHSYAGILAGPVAERAAGLLASVTYLGAFVARPGQCLLDVEPPEVAQRYRELAASGGDGWRVPASPSFLAQWGISDPALRARLGPRLTDFPLRCLTDPAQFDPRPLDGIRTVYIRHTRPPLASLQKSVDLAVASGWETRELPCGHDLMLAAPGETAALLDDIARLRS
jgi:pimeloyl-ACP methyl ester carboxylesterase